MMEMKMYGIPDLVVLAAGCRSAKRSTLQQGKSVEFHLWQACRGRCKPCNVTFVDVKRTLSSNKHLPQEACLAMVGLIGGLCLGRPRLQEGSCCSGLEENQSTDQQ